MNFHFPKYDRAMKKKNILKTKLRKLIQDLVDKMMMYSYERILANCKDVNKT